jgi:putative flippase GtrA
MRSNILSLAKGIITKEMLVRFVTFTVCGGLATICDWGAFYVAAYLIKLNYLLAVSLSFSLGAIVNYILNKIITFNNLYKNIPVQFIVFISGALSALLLTYLQLIILIEYLDYSAMNSRMISSGIMLFYNFFYHKSLTFGKLK